MGFRHRFRLFYRRHYGYLAVLCEWDWLVDCLGVSLTSKLISNYTQGRVAQQYRMGAIEDVFLKAK